MQFTSMQFTIEIRNTRNNKGLGLPYRQYVWKGGETLDDQNGNGEQDPGEEMKSWCFVYGEEEWINNVSFQKTKDNTERHVLGRGNSSLINAETECE